MNNLAQPKWVIEYFCQRASIINNIVAENKTKKSVDEAARIGRALGFGAEKRGKPLRVKV